MKKDFQPQGSVDSRLSLRNTPSKSSSSRLSTTRMASSKQSLSNYPTLKGPKQLIRLPGLIDVHVHTRDPGDTQKEDFESCTAAALAGGITMICAMPDTSPALVDQVSLDTVREIAQQKARCDYALYAAAYSGNIETVCELAPQTAALKMFLSDTFSNLEMNNMGLWYRHIENWPKATPVCVHADTEIMAAVILFARFHNKPIHICHVSNKAQIALIKAAKIRGHKVTCEACPENLFLSTGDLKKLNPPLNEESPPIGTEEDREALWENLAFIDCFCSNHSPHTAEEKVDEGYPGLPGLETMLPLLLNAVFEGKLTLDELIDKCYNNPRRIFNLPEQPDTFVEIDPEKEWVIPNKMPHSKSGWTPFSGTKIKGYIRKVILRGRVVYEDGNVLAPPGYGQNLRESEDTEGYPSVSTTELKPIRISSLTVHGIENKDIIDMEVFNKESLTYMYDLARSMKTSVSKELPVDHILKGKVLANVFYEVSTRTRCSFACAMQRLGGGVIYLNDLSSSARTGESIEDAVTVLGNYADVIVVRHPIAGTALKTTKACTKPVINGGDGVGEHPTQALLAAFTIREELGTINGLTIAMVGDLKNGRTVHSFAKLLTNYNVSLLYISAKNLRMPKDVFDYVASRGIPQRETTSLDSVLSDMDVVYMTRIQRERFTNPEEYSQALGRYIITPQLMAKAKKRMIVLHPLPRVYEIRPDFDSDPRAAYFRQAENGLFIRMALLAMVLGVC